MTDTSTYALIDAIVSRLATVLPPLVSAAGMPPVNRFLPYTPGNWSTELSRSPCVYVDVARKDRSDLAAYGGAVSRIAKQRSLTVCVTAAGQDPETANRHFWGYTDLVEAVMEGDQSANGQGLSVTWQDTRTSPNMGPGMSLYRVACATFEIPRWAALGQD